MSGIGGVTTRNDLEVLYSDHGCLDDEAKVALLLRLTGMEMGPNCFGVSEAEGVAVLEEMVLNGSWKLICG